MKHDAVLRNVAFLGIGKPAVGVIYEDERGRFPEGTEVTTSPVKEVVYEGYDRYLVTQNTTYFVEDDL